MELPPELACIPETTVDIFLCNVSPCDGDWTWGDLFTNIMDNQIVEQTKKGCNFMGIVSRSI